ncbi:serine hydrolase domain-containing protein [Brumimicrobium aurantiacum]|uniref:Class C beta-lactamase-related serine hydrolase n=1 Tax=Brumimicrobium aurantiacum TaxID=1737063 RepID=A0A3E1EVC4_9FLAO|nr:serine hydrolase [Brumimicrobium aurantiacum]RFC53511.1 class C beta-lactamase-related serine hydrolase [Brumimicrobium aurantiacum]
MKKYHLITVISLAILLSSCKVGRFFVYNFAGIQDHKIFPNRTIEKGDSSFTFIEGIEKKPKSITQNDEKMEFDEFLKAQKSVAFMIIRNDSILYEKYFRTYDESSIVPSFSMAKSVTSILVGIAIDEGFIRSVDEPVTNYIPELKANGFDKVTLKHLLQMTSGLDYNEGYFNPFGDVATFYYGTKLRQEIPKMQLKHEPGEKFEYLSGNTQILGLVLERALNGTTISDYLQEKLWIPLGMEYDASWSTDHKENGIEKTFCCLNARARDFAKIGRLYLNKGNWNGKQIVSEEWVETSTKIDRTEGSERFYQYQWWLPSDNGDFMAQGILGQYIYVYPEKNLIIVRLGKKQGNTSWWSVLTSLGKAY